jgi:hypothetical protein
MSKIPIPKRLKLRPLYRGLPIPYIAMIKADGQPDFRVTDEVKRMQVIMNKWCQLCGEPLGRWFFFVGGTEAAKANHYFEPAAHLECLIYAMQVCPFIVGRIEHADLEKVQKDYDQQVARQTTAPGGEPVLEKVKVHADETFSTVRNPYWVIKKAVDWRLARTKDGTILIIPSAVASTTPIHAESMTPDEWARIEKELKA